MVDMNDLAAKKATLAAIEAEIAAATATFEESIADLRAQCETLRAEYMQALRAEMESVERPPVPNLGSVLAAIEHTHQPIMIRRLRKLAVRYLVGARTEHHAEPEPGLIGTPGPTP